MYFQDHAPIFCVLRLRLIQKSTALQELARPNGGATSLFLSICLQTLMENAPIRQHAAARIRHSFDCMEHGTAQ